MPPLLIIHSQWPALRTALPCRSDTSPDRGGMRHASDWMEHPRAASYQAAPCPASTTALWPAHKTLTSPQPSVPFQLLLHILSTQIRFNRRINYPSHIIHFLEYTRFQNACSRSPTTSSPANGALCPGCRSHRHRAACKLPALQTPLHCSNQYRSAQPRK